MDKIQEKTKRTYPTSIFCLVFFFMAGMVLAIEFLPPDVLGFIGPVTKREENTLHITLPLAGISVLIGIALHVFFYRRDPERFDVKALRTGALGMGSIMAAMFTISFILSRTSDTPPHVFFDQFDQSMRGFMVFAMSLLVLIGILFFGFLFFTIKYGTGNRMARKMQAGDIAGAIRIGEARPRHKRNFLTTYNLAVAYLHAGDEAMARKLQAQIEQLKEAPKHFTQESFGQCKDALRMLIEGEPAGSE